MASDWQLAKDTKREKLWWHNQYAFCGLNFMSSSIVESTGAIVIIFYISTWLEYMFFLLV